MSPDEHGTIYWMRLGREPILKKSIAERLARVDLGLNRSRVGALRRVVVNVS